jgi:hypothetical protein
MGTAVDDELILVFFYASIGCVLCLSPRCGRKSGFAAGFLDFVDETVAEGWAVGGEGEVRREELGGLQLQGLRI